MSRKVFAILAALGLAALLTLPALAQDATPEATGEMTMPAMPNAIASGLSSPFGINYDADGNLFIAEGGSGGPIEIPGDPNASPDEPGAGGATMGFTSQITEVAADGTQSVALGGLVSVATAEGGGGAFKVYPKGDSLWITIGGGASGPQPFYGDAVLEVNKSNGRIKTYIDVFDYEQTQNPDGADPIDSNLTTLAWDAKGQLYIIDTGGNDILTWTAADGLKTFKVWKDDPVPTDLEFADDGTFYVGFLGTGIAPMAGHIEHWSADGQTLIETFGNLTAVTDIAIGQDGKLYAVQLLTQFGDQGPVPNTGSVVQVSADGVTPVAENLPQPYSIAQAPDGSWVVSVNSAFAPPGSGAVIKIG
jgi:hypothetical protein